MSSFKNLQDKIDGHIFDATVQVVHSSEIKKVMLRKSGQFIGKRSILVRDIECAEMWLTLWKAQAFSIKVNVGDVISFSALKLEIYLGKMSASLQFYGSYKKVDDPKIKEVFADIKD